MVSIFRRKKEDPSDPLSKYAKDHVVSAAQEDKTVSYPSKCRSCSAVTRLVANHHDRQWQCPLCGAALPYVFWKVSRDVSFEVKGAKGLIISLASDACQVCGESNSIGENDKDGMCRCRRIKRRDLEDRIRNLYTQIDEVNRQQIMEEIQKAAEELKRV